MSSTPRARLPIGRLIVGLVLAGLLAGLAYAVASGVDLVQIGRQLVGAMRPPESVTEQGQEIRDLYDIVFVIAVAVFVLVEGLIIWTVLRYRRKPGDDDLPAQTHGNFLAEVVWTLVPTAIVAFLFVISWQTLNSIEAVSQQPDVKVKVNAAQFYWTFDYYDADGETILFTQASSTGAEGGLFLPVGRSVQLELHAPDVIHAFYVPQFLFKRDIIPGVTNVFEFRVNEADAGQTFRGQCAELCGLGHGNMVFDVHALTSADYDAWRQAKIEAAQASPTPPPTGDPGETLELVAQNIEFDRKALTAKAGEPFTIRLTNQDTSIPHNVRILDQSGAVIFDGEILPSVGTIDYAIPALEAGSYVFDCSIHPIPAMTGTLTVEP